MKHVQGTQSKEKDSTNEKQDLRQLRHSFRMAIAGLLLLVLVATGTTYAWFSLSGRASTYVTPMAGTISEGSGSLLISSSSNGPFDKICDLVYTGSFDSLKPVSTADLTHFYKASAQNKNGIAISYKNADDKVDRETLHGTVYLQCLNASCDVYFNKNELALGSDPQALAAMRLGMKITAREGSKTYIFRLDDLGSTGSAQSKQTVPENATVVSSVTANGQAEYRSDPATGLSGYMVESGSGEEDFSAGASRLVRLEADETASVEYWIYLEGCDEQCVNEVQNRNSEIQLAFAGVDVNE